MNHKESVLILEKIKPAKKILLSCHRSPDPDSIASNLSMYHILRDMGKDVTLISPDKVYPNYSFLPDFDVISKVDFLDFNFKEFDLFIILDASSFDQVAGIKNIKIPNIPIITIDHHITNEKYGFLNLLDITSSTCEVLYRLYCDWDVKINSVLATTLLTGIYADSVSFQTDKTKSSTFSVTGELIDHGADVKSVILNLFHSNDFNLIKFWSELIRNMEIDLRNRFVWTAADYKIYSNYGKPSEAKSLFANIIVRTIKDTDFGVVMVEQKPGVLNVSLRSRTDFDVSVIAKEFKGSGHISSAGCWFEFKNYDTAVDRVLNVARKYAKKYNSKR